jgi:hypothetical protein
MKTEKYFSLIIPQESYMLVDTLLGSGSERPKDQALLLTMVSYLKKIILKGMVNPTNPPISEKLPKWHFLTHA